MLEITDGVVTIRSPVAHDRRQLIAGRDDEFHRFLGEGSPDPDPTACVVVRDEVVGWVDSDRDRAWLESGEVNLGYNVFAEARGHGYGTRALKLLLHHLALTGSATVASLLIDPENDRSLGLAARADFERHGDLDGNTYWKLAVPPLSYSDGLVTIRRREAGDLEIDLEAKDDEQLRWLWLPWQREAWAAMSESARRDHAARVLAEDHERFGHGPKWAFSVDADGRPGVGYVDCDLDNGDVPSGEANISYACHPAHRGRGVTSRAVRLVAQFLRDHTAARWADLIVDDRNEASVRVALAVGAQPVGRGTTDDGEAMVRHRLPLRPASPGAG